MKLREKKGTKDSGIAWIGTIPEHWEMKRTKFLFSLARRQPREGDGIVTAFRDGQVTLRSNRRTDGFTNAVKEAGYQGVRKGDLVIHAMDAFAGAIGVSDSDGKCTPVYSCCMPKANASSDFYARCVRTMATTGFIESLSKGIRERSSDFRWATFAEQFLPVPPLKEQAEIGTFIDREAGRIDALVTRKTCFIELLREKRQALIAYVVTKGLDARVPMKDSGVAWLGQVPQHWGVFPSKRLFAVRSEPARPDDRVLTSSQKYGVIYQSDFVETEGRRVVEVILGIENLKHVEPDDFVISMRSFQGGLEWCQLRGSTSFHYVMIKPIKHVWPAFFAHLFKSAPYIHALRRTSDLIRDGQELRYSNFIEVPLPVIPIEEQKRIAAYVDNALSRIDILIAKIERSIELLREHRTALITAAVTGKIDLRAA